MLLFLFLMLDPAVRDVLADEPLPLTLKPCPSSPNCVSSLTADPGRRIEPLPVYESDSVTLALLEKTVRTFPRAAITVRGNRYLKAEFRTRLGFVDDVEFLLDTKEGVIQARSASRTGYWDLGVNRRRMESIRKAYLQSKKSP